MCAKMAHLWHTRGKPEVLRRKPWSGSSPGLNLSGCRVSFWCVIFGVGCAASRRSAGESASRSGAAKRRNCGGSPSCLFAVW